MICKLWSSCLGLNVLKASFPHARYYHDYSNPLHIRKPHGFPTYLLTWLLHTSAWKYGILRNDYKTLQSFTKILFSLVWWQVWNIDSYHILSKGSLWWNIDSTVVSKNIGQVSGVPLHWKPRVVMTLTLPSPRLSLWWQLAGSTVMTKLALRQFSILGIIHGLVNIRITNAIHCHSQRFLESESLSYYRV